MINSENKKGEGGDWNADEGAEAGKLGICPKGIVEKPVFIFDAGAAAAVFYYF